jgi:hypothetical protein
VKYNTYYERTDSSGENIDSSISRDSAVDSSSTNTDYISDNHKLLRGQEQNNHGQPRL